jgi:hypothetical protein
VPKTSITANVMFFTKRAPRLFRESLNFLFCFSELCAQPFHFLSRLLKRWLCAPVPFSSQHLDNAAKLAKGFLCDGSFPKGHFRLPCISNVSFPLLPFQGVQPQLLKHGFDAPVKKKERPNWPLLHD